MKFIFMYPVVIEGDKIVIHTSVMEGESLDNNESEGPIASIDRARSTASHVIKETIKNSPILDKCMKYFTFGYRVNSLYLYDDLRKDSCEHVEIQTTDKELEAIINNYDLLKILYTYEFDSIKYIKATSQKYKSDPNIEPYPLVNFDLYDKIKKECKTSNTRFKDYIAGLIDEITVALEESTNEEYDEYEEFDIETRNRIFDVALDELKSHDGRLALSEVKERLLAAVIIGAKNVARKANNLLELMTKCYDSKEALDNVTKREYTYVSNDLIENPCKDCHIIFSESKPSHAEIAILETDIGVRVYVYDLRKAFMKLDEDHVYSDAIYDIEKSSVFVDYGGHLMSTVPINFEGNDYIPLNGLPLESKTTSLAKFFIDLYFKDVTNHPANDEATIATNYIRKEDVQSPETHESES